MFHKKQEEKPQVDNVPAVGNNLSEKEKTKLAEIQQIHQEAKEDQKRTGKFFTLEIGEKTRIIVNFAKTEVFKTKRQDGELVDQFRYFVIDQRYPEYEKQFDTWFNVSQAIVYNIENGHSEMGIKAIKNQLGKRKYVIVPYDEEE